MIPRLTTSGRRPRRALGGLVAACLLLGGCEDPRERITRNNIHQLAFSAAQLHEALSQCDGRGATAAEHARLWNDALTGAEGWIGLSRESIAARLAAGREAFSGVDERLCPSVIERASASLEQAKRLRARVAAQELCSLMGCG